MTFLEKLKFLKKNIKDLSDDPFLLESNASEYEAITLKERVFQAYHIKLLKKLNAACNDDNPLSALIEVLKENWNLVKGNLLCYTACPDLEITKLLCDISEAIAKELNANKTNIYAHCTPLQILIPDLLGESLVKEYPDLAGKDSPENINTLEVLRTHVIDDLGSYLLPISLLSTLEIEDDNNMRISNPYFDVFSRLANDNPFIADATISRLFRHSLMTSDLEQAIENYCKYLFGGEDLLGHLNRLIKHLKFNSIEGVGTSENAGEAVYTAIISFFNYYNELDTEIKNKIPTEVEKEITLLHDLVSDANANSNATENLATCINTRRKALSTAIYGKEALLKSIEIDGQKKSELLATAKKQFEEHKRSLALAIENSTYYGVDNLGLKASLLNQLDVPLIIDSEEDLQDFLTLSASEIIDLANNNSTLRDDILNQLNTIDKIVVFIHANRSDRIEAVLPLIESQLIDGLSYHHSLSYNLNLLFTTLDVSQTRIVCSSCKTMLWYATQNGGDLEIMLKSLSDEQKAIIIESIKSDLPYMINKSSDLRPLFRVISENNHESVYRAVKNKLINSIKTGADFKLIADCLPANPRAEIFDAIKPRLANLIQCSLDFTGLLYYLTPEQCKDVCIATEKKLTSIFSNANAFGIALSKLSPLQCKVICSTLINTMPDLIKDHENFGQMFYHLSVKQGAAVFDSIKIMLPNYIANIHQLKMVLQSLTGNQCKFVCESLGTKILNIIKSGNDFTNLLSSLSVSQRAGVFAVLNNKILEIVKNGSDLGNVMSYFTPTQRTELYAVYKNELPKLILNGDNFGKVLYQLNNIQRVELIDMMECELPCIIQNGIDLALMLQSLSNEQRAKVLGIIKIKILNIIQRTVETYELNSFMKHLSNSELLSIIPNANELIALLQELPDYQRVIMLQNIHKVLPSIFDNTVYIDNSYQKLLTMVSDLSPDIVADSMRAFLRGKLKESYGVSRNNSCIQNNEEEPPRKRQRFH